MNKKCFFIQVAFKNVFLNGSGFEKYMCSVLKIRIFGGRRGRGESSQKGNVKNAFYRNEDLLPSYTMICLSGGCIGSALLRAFGGGGRGDAGELSIGQVWRDRERQVKRAISRMLLKHRLFSALSYHDP